MKRTKNTAGASKKMKTSSHAVPTSFGEREEVTEKTKIDYTFFRYIFKNKRKSGICILCEKKGRPVEIPMLQSNTSGLRNHLSNHHPVEHEILFGPIAETSACTQKLDMFITVRICIT